MFLRFSFELLRSVDWVIYSPKDNVFVVFLQTSTRQPYVGVFGHVLKRLEANRCFCASSSSDKQVDQVVFL
jgi:hypothetical protein